VDEPGRPVQTPNRLIRVDKAGRIERIVELPASVNALGRYSVKEDAWMFAYYLKAVPTSPNGGWTGLSDIAFADKNTVVVVERDNQGGPDARIKELRSFRLSDVIFRPEGQVLDVITRGEQTLVRNLVPDLLATNGYVIEKVEGLAITKHGDVIINTDNDGVEDHSGETRQVKLGRLF
jgi:hypothetical protein